MKNPGRMFLISAFIGVMCLLASPVIAGSLTDDGGIPTGPHGPREGNMSGLLDHLEGLGFDLSPVREALTLGNIETARVLLDAFFQEHKDALPAPPVREMSGNASAVNETFEEAPPKPGGNREGRMLGILGQFEELGYDMSAIRTEIAAGDLDTAQVLMRQFLEEHIEELPSPCPGAADKRLPGLLHQSDQETTGTSPVRAAITPSGRENAPRLPDTGTP